MDIRGFRPYLLAILTVFLALQALWFIQPYISISPPFITFLAAIMVIAWYGGFRPALFAIVLSAITIDYYFIRPPSGFTLTKSGGIRNPRLFWGCRRGDGLCDRLSSACSTRRSYAGLGSQMP